MWRGVGLHTGTGKNLGFKRKFLGFLVFFSFLGFKVQHFRHWRILVKNMGWANQNIGEGQKVVKSSDKCIGVSQLLGARARAAPLPQSLSLWL